MEEKKKTKFNLSASSLNTYYESPLLFYLKYIARVPDDTDVPVCYGLSGSIVHDCLEKYVKGELTQDEAYTYFIEEWEKQELHVHKDLKGEVLDKMPYILALTNGMRIVADYEDHVCEEDFLFPLIETEDFEIGMRGFIDLQTTQVADKQKVIVDYKTSNRVDEGENFKRQALFYSMLIHKKKGYIPAKTVFHYLKLGAKKEYSFTIEEVIEFEKELESVAKEIISYKNEISRFPAGDVSSIFNSKQKACMAELEARKKAAQQKKLDIF